jgi:hypothetical protein
MTRSGLPHPSLAALADLLIDHVRNEAVLDCDELARDAITELQTDLGIQLSLVDPSLLPEGCSIAASYNHRTSPPTIKVAADLSSGRRAFSALHEYAHHLIRQVIDVLEVLFQRAEAGPLEEDICDTFASRILIPPAVVGDVFADGVTAAAVVELARRVSASDEACAVAACQSMPMPGYVMLLDQDGVATFTARTPGQPRVARLTHQTGATLRGIARVRRGRGHDSVTFATGNTSPTLHLDAAPAGTGTLVVLVADSPPWEKFTRISTRVGARRPEGYCEACGDSFIAESEPCLACGELRCPRCGECGCVPGQQPARGERECLGCHMTLGPGAFPIPQSTLCRTCG